MKDINSIPDSFNSLLNSFHSSCETFTSSSYTTRDHTQLIQRNDLKSRSSSRNLVRNEPQKIPPELFAASIATRQNENVAIGRTKAQNPRCSAQKKGNLRRHETLTDRSLQAFLAAIAVRKRDDIAHRYNLEKAAQVGTRSLQITIKPLQKAARTLRATKCSTQLTDYQARSFWQWIEPPPDLPICILEGAASGVCARLQVLNIVERVLPPTMESAS